jgi:hypothetical protein
MVVTIRFEYNYQNIVNARSRYFVENRYLKSQDQDFLQNLSKKRQKSPSFLLKENGFCLKS